LLAGNSNGRRERGGVRESEEPGTGARFEMMVQKRERGGSAGKDAK